MMSKIQKIGNTLRQVSYKWQHFCIGVSVYFTSYAYAQAAAAVHEVDIVNRDTSNGGTLSDVLGNVSQFFRELLGGMEFAFAVIGVGVLAASCLKIYQVNREGRSESLAGAYIGIFVGFLMLGIVAVAQYGRNTVVGTPAG